MKCNIIQDQIFPLLHRELSGEKRVVTLNHIRSCPECRAHYTKALKYTYQKELEIIKSLPENFAEEFNTELMGQIHISSKRAGRYKKLITAAVVVLLMTMTFMMIQPPVSDIKEKNRLAVLIENEDWSGLARILNKGEGTENRIPVRLIKNKLEKIRDGGMDHINIDILTLVMSSHSNNFVYTLNMNAKIQQPNPGQILDINNAIMLISQFEKYKSNASIQELMRLYQTIKKEEIGHDA